MQALTTDQVIALVAAGGQVAAAFFAVLALLVSIRTASRQSQVSERLARDSAALASRLAREQGSLQFEQLKMQRDSDILRWTERCIDLLADAETFAAGIAGGTGPGSARPLDEPGKARLSLLLARLSALIDQGRLYFPNEEPAIKGGDKPEAFRGFRQRILSVLVRAFDELAKAGAVRTEGDSGVRRGKLIDLRRIFVSEAQIAIDPRRLIALRDLNVARAEHGIKQQTGAETDWTADPRSDRKTV